MPPKRSLDVANDDQHHHHDEQTTSPTKRAKREGFTVPQTPVASTSALPCMSSSATSSGLRSLKTRLSTPATPYTPFPLHPSDSPSNPFKKQKNVDSLPPITSFSKHIALRFQMHRRGPNATNFAKGGVHRVVQVPLNYTFTHLRAVISWLFDTPIECTNGKGGGEEEYLFEVKTGIAMENALRKPGMIKSGRTTMKISNTRDPWRKRYGRGVDEEDELSDEESDDGDDGEDSGDWIWADEEEYTLGHVWVTGVRADRGVILHLSPYTQIHITANTTKLPRRRGKSNVPYIFFARGRVHLAPRPLPRPIFANSDSIIQALSSSPLRPKSSQTSSKGSRFSGNKRRSPKKLVKRASPELLHPIEHSPDAAADQDDVESDTDADGEVEADLDESHPFFQTLDREESPSKKRGKEREVAVIDDSDDEIEVISPRKAARRDPASPEVIYVEDTDEESNHEGSSDESEPPSSQQSEMPDRLIDPSHWNKEYWAFGRYLLGFLDPRGTSTRYSKQKVGDEVFEKEEKERERKARDDFEDDDDEEEEEEQPKKRKKVRKAEPEVEEEEYVEEDSMFQEGVVEVGEEDEDPGEKATPALTNASASSHTSSSLPPSSPFVRGIVSSSPSAPWKGRLFSSDASFASDASSTSQLDPLLLSPTSTLLLHPQLIAPHYPNRKYINTPAPNGGRKHRVRLERVERVLARGKKGDYLCAADEMEEGPDAEDEGVDELDEDADGEGEVWVKPMLKPGEIWDPFGDEPEI